MNIFPIIMAGGSGTRFWPASRSSVPKQFLKILGSKTMIELTVDRVIPLCPADHVVIVGSAKHHDLLAVHREQQGMVVFEEPVGRNTAPCIGLAAAYLRKQGMSTAAMVILPADHFISDPERFRTTLSIGCELAQKEGAIVTVGIVPTRPETGYGYLQQGPLVKKIEDIATYRIERFVEKPNIDDALRYVESGNFLWNGGIFIATAETILEEIEMHLPSVYAGLLEIEAALDTDRFPSALQTAYEAFPSISIDYGIMEKTTRPVMTVPGDFGWCDVGSWESLYNLRKTEADDNGNLADGESMLLDTTGSLIFNETPQLVVALGLEETVIVNTADALLVANIKKSQDIKKVIEELTSSGQKSLL